MVRDFIEPSELESISEKTEKYEILHVFTNDEIEDFNKKHMELSIEEANKKTFLAEVKDILTGDCPPDEILERIEANFTIPESHMGFKSLKKELSSIMAKVRAGEENRLVDHFVVNIPEEGKKAIYKPDGHLLKVRAYYDNESSDNTGDLFAGLPDEEETGEESAEE